jgi:hypothetical protein
MQMPDQPDETRLIGVDRKPGDIQIGLDHHDLKRTRGFERMLLYLASHLDVVGTDVVHVLAPRSGSYLSATTRS